MSSSNDSYPRPSPPLPRFAYYYAAVILLSGFAYGIYAGAPLPSLVFVVGLGTALYLFIALELHRP